MPKEDLLAILQEWNLWEHNLDVGIRRHIYLKKLLPLLDRKEVLVLTGIRRSGKSTIMKQLMKELIKKGIEKRQLLYLNLEDYALRNNLSLKLLEEVLATYQAYSGNKKKVYFFIDEVQNIEGWERYVRTKYDQQKNIKFIVSGSNASLLSKELSTLLTGRNITLQVMTLSYREFQKFTKSGDIEDFLTFGGFPEVVLEKNNAKKKLLLQQYFTDIVHKDIIARHQVRDPNVVLKLAQYIVANSGSKVSMNNLAKTFGISDDTIASYLSYMVDAYLLIHVPFFSYSLKKRHSILTQPKYYASDNGFIFATSIPFSRDQGKKYENAVLLKIREETNEIAYWSRKHEVDFVFGQTAMNVTSHDDIAKREYDGLFEFQKRFPDKKLILVSRKKKQKGKVMIVPFEEFCLKST